jgi:glycosyltransferase involved in cell wall biosynthesis
VLVIDDATPDPNVFPWLVERCRRYGFELLRNEKNLGFVGTCNRGFEESEPGHVLILNSDTVPFPGWLSAMLAAIDDGVASVTAVSNNATIYSLPHPGINPFSTDFSPADLANLIPSAIPADPIVIPTGVGFCMLMTRSALDAVGTFDLGFGKGYGEENDWCMRASRLGFTHVLAPHAFVYHEGNASMAEAGVIVKGQTTHAQNEGLLLSRYPEYPSLVDEFLAQPEITLLRRDAAGALLKILRGRRPTILHWLHADPYARHAGGTELAVRGLIDGLSREVFVLIVHPTPNGRVEVSWRANDVVLRRTIDLTAEGFKDDSAAWERLAGRIIEIETPDVFHFHHGYLSSASAAHAAQKRMVPTVVSLHDFHLVCPRNHLLDRWGSYCGIPSSTVICDACVSVDAFSIEAWRTLSEQVLIKADVVTATDPSILELAARGIPALRQRHVRIIPPTPVLERGHDMSLRRPGRRVLISGRVEASHKGGLILEDLIERLLAYGMEVHSVGSDDLAPRPGLAVHGTYERSQFNEMLRRIDPDVAIIPSVVPESFSITLSELWAAGIPVIARDIGALGRRIRELGGGFLVHEADAGSFLNAAVEVIDHPERIDEAIDRIRGVSEIEEFNSPVIQYQQIYSRLIFDRDPQRSPEQPSI